MKYTSVVRALAVATLGLLITASSAPAQGTAFTYQGRLNSSGSAATGSYDLQFAIWDALVGGTQQGNGLTNSATAVSNGLFTVTLDFGNQFPGANRWLEISVRTNGGGALTTLIPRQQLAASPYAITAGTITGPVNGGLILPGTVTGTQLAVGSIGSSQLAAGAAASNLNAAGQSGVAGGGMVLSASDNNAALANAGYFKIGVTTTSDTWQQRDDGTPLAPRYYHTAIWTGSEMIIWGGYGGSYLNDGGRYNPVANSWT